ncbi:hydroxyethylthiazole kinase [Sphaerotilus mobilis]|uniref:Hydroxyethylthiazole kinase n=1 Tax=Sphaerotilus mobilis TaxID=47994 RepID=A0A4Q7LSW9_9BURK|nr:hydroxyethylthiazole kinase [Sphaerotilus mobilis]RZS57098.1 hydroxyethylthiazole kinase [Sphaerotilus mobilis]
MGAAARSTLTPADVWADLQAVRARGPLVHSITNFVVMNLNANVLLALGASPVMAHAHEEVADMASIAQALVLNIGTLDAAWIESMRIAQARAHARGIPVVLDPVGAGATPYRNLALASLIDTHAPSILRGNGSEVMSVAGLAAATRGVDSAASSDDAVAAARTFAARTGAVVCVSGAIDHVVDADGRWVRLANGHPWMTRITGVGCSATAMIGAFAAVQGDAWRATASAMAVMGVAGEWAAERAQAAGGGVGRMQGELLDALHLLDEATLLARLRVLGPQAKPA